MGDLARRFEAVEKIIGLKGVHELSAALIDPLKLTDSELRNYGGLKYFKMERTDGGTGNVGMVLQERIFSIEKDDGIIIFREECDGYFFEKFTKDQAVELLTEAINYINI